MIEAVMYVALGFCTAGLLCLAILPAFYRRAARLTEEALRAVNPSSYAEVRAAQDQERAQHAVDLRRAEQQLEAERQKAATHHAAVSRLKTEMEALANAHQNELLDLKAEVQSKANDHKTVDLLSSEVSALKQKLADAEKALAESWSEKTDKLEADSSTPQLDNNDTDWLPATDTMALATITGLESEVATLKAKLAKYEPSVAIELDNERTETARTRLAELEAQLVDTESKFVTAQAEVTRLSLQLEAGDIKETDLQKHLTEQLQALATENAKHLSELKAKERSVERLTGQIGKLQQDLIATSTLAQVRQDFRQLVRQFSGEAQTIEETSASAAPTKPRAQAKAQVQTKNAASGELNPKKRARKAATAAPEAQAATQNVEKPADQSSTADIATAAEALVSRIVASNRKNNSETEKASLSSETKTEIAPADNAGARRKPRTAKPKNKDVA